MYFVEYARGGKVSIMMLHARRRPSPKAVGFAGCAAAAQSRLNVHVPVAYRALHHRPPLPMTKLGQYMRVLLVNAGSDTCQKLLREPNFQATVH